ncbi:MAG: hypothetical protein A2W07_08800 [candidate division Zixibacteria bacterium RBG_16_43_9]|nr:MAG: hypothetical protein A2W07_08800 [candidate division Zixibacteria bacterium RBG_16_43_9]
MVVGQETNDKQNCALHWCPHQSARGGLSIDTLSLVGQETNKEQDDALGWCPHQPRGRII